MRRVSVHRRSTHYVRACSRDFGHGHNSPPASWLVTKRQQAVALTSFPERPQLFREGFRVGVAIGPNPCRGTVGVGMKYLATDRRKHQPLIRRQVELERLFRVYVHQHPVGGGSLAAMAGNGHSRNRYAGAREC
jgi:hypothetical protein